MPRKSTRDRQCVICGATCRGSVCSPACGAEYQRRKHQAKRTTLICPQCQQPFTVSPARAATARFCSQACYGKAKTGEQRTPRLTLTCEHCGADFERLASRIRKKHMTGQYCSVECSNAAQHDHRVERRAYVLTQAWREFVLDRDGNQCQACGATEQLHVHHVRPWRTFPAGRFDPANGITLCERCHMALHRRFTLAQLTLPTMHHAVASVAEGD